MNVFVIVITYNGKYWIDRCFTSLRDSEIPLTVVMVDNLSNDDSVSYIKMNYPEVVQICLNENKGFGYANNIGIKYAINNGAEYIFLLNQDAWIEVNTMSKLIEISKKHREYGVLSPLHLNAQKNNFEKGLLTYLNDSKFNNVDFISDLYFKRLDEVYDVKYVNAAAWLLPIETIKIVGGFDPLFFHYGEDDNYMQRVVFHGMKIGICPNIYIVHDTDIRVEQESKALQTNYKSLLVQVTDVNDYINIKRFYFYFFRKALFTLFKLKFNKSKELFKKGIYIYRLRDRIEKSKLQNRKIEMSWINYEK